MSNVLEDNTQHSSENRAFTKRYNLGNDDENENMNNNNDSLSPPPIKINLKPIGDNDNDNTETWDGFKKFNNIPIEPTQAVRKEPPISREELLKKKVEYLRKLETLKKKGAQLSKEYDMESSLDEMKGEYEMIISEKEKSNSIKFQGKIMMAMVTALEYLNNKFDPFDLKLDGWSESVSENIDDYDEIFAELHEKYKSKAKMAPELKLLFQLGGSAVMLHMSNTMFKSALPGMDDIMKQNPELMQQFTAAAVNSMSQRNPGFGGFMGGLMNSGQGQGGGAPTPGSNTMGVMPPRGSPPGPPPSQSRPPTIPPGPPSNRPDIGMSRGQPQFADAENMDEYYATYRGGNNEDMFKPQRTMRTPGGGSGGGSGSGSGGSGGGSGGGQRESRTSTRPEMKGPSDINDLLAGLKPKQVALNSDMPPPSLSKMQMTRPINANNNSSMRKPTTAAASSSADDMDNQSMISVDELRTMKKDLDNLPRKSQRRKRTERNTVSLDI
jgi:hypothetical protein